MRRKDVFRSLILGPLLLGTAFGAGVSPEPPHLVPQHAGLNESVASIAVSPDGSLIATGSGPVRIYDARTGALRKSIGSDRDLGGHTVAFLPDSRTVASAGYHMDKLARLWDVQTGATVRTFAGHTEIETYTTAVSPDGRLLASCGTDKQILIWDTATGTIRHQIKDLPFPVSAIAFSPDGATFATGSGDRLVRLWDAKTGQPIRSLKGHRDWITTIAFAPDGKTLASGSCDWSCHRGRDTTRFEGRDPGFVSEWKLWDPATGELKRTVSEPGRILSLAFSPDGQSLVCGSGSDVRLYDLRSEDSGRVVTSHESGVTSVAFARDGQAIFSASHDRTVRRVAVATGTIEWSLPGYWEQVNAVAISRDGSRIVTGGSDVRFALNVLKAGARGLGPGAVRLWDARTGHLIRRLGNPADQILAVALSPDGQHIVSGGSGAIHLWDAETESPLWSREDHKGDVFALAYSPDGSVLVSAGADGLVRLRDPKTGDVTRTLEGHGGGATSVAFSANGKILACGAADGSALLWDPHKGERLRTITPFGSMLRPITGVGRLVTSVSLTHDGETLALVSGGSGFGDRIVRIWDTRTGEMKRQISTSQNHGRLAVFSPDGNVLAVSGTGKAIHLWDIRADRMIHSLAAHAHPPQSAMFSADGRFLVSGGDYRTTIVWDVAAGRQLATLTTCNESRPGTTSDDWLIHTPEGYYDGSPGVDRFVAWRVGDDLKTAEELGPHLHRPDRIAAALSGKR